MKLKAVEGGYVILGDDGTRLATVQGSPGRYEVRDTAGKLLGLAVSVTSSLVLLRKKSGKR